MRQHLHYTLWIVLLLLGGCKKEVEKIVVQDKEYSWALIPRLYGIQQIILNMSKDAQSLYLQNPNLQSTLSPLPTSAAYRRNGYLLGASTSFPSDLNLRIPMSADFTVQPTQNDTVLYLRRPSLPVRTDLGTYIRLRQLDPLATGIAPVAAFSYESFGAINRNNYLLVGCYATNRSVIKLVLSQVTLQPYAGDMALQAASRLLTFPGTQPIYAGLRWIIAIDDYFLVNYENQGIYKVTQNGDVRRVYSPVFTDTCYKWQGVLYMVEEYNSILKSTDDGETWTRYTNTPDAFTFSTYRVVSDSLVGIKHGPINLLYTLRWNGTNYRIRELKSDGLGQGEINGLTQLGDTVYVGTTGGLFKRPLTKFFESRL